MSQSRLKDLWEAKPKQKASVVAYVVTLLALAPVTFLLRVPAIPYLWLSNWCYFRERRFERLLERIYEAADKRRDEELAREIEKGEDDEIL